MESLDFVYDLTDKLQKQKMNYAVIVLQKFDSKKPTSPPEYRGNVFYEVDSADAAKVLAYVMSEVQRDIVKKTRKRKKK